MYLLSAMQKVKNLITESGLAADFDPARLTIPSVLIQPTGWEPATLTSADLAVTLWLIAGDTSTDATMDTLGKMHAILTGVVGTGPVRFQAIRLPSQAPDPLPAITIETKFSIENLE